MSPRETPAAEPTRLQQFASEKAREFHNRYSDSAGVGSSNGHYSLFEVCPHPDCVMVRSAAPSAGPDLREQIEQLQPPMPDLIPRAFRRRWQQGFDECRDAVLALLDAAKER